MDDAFTAPMLSPCLFRRVKDEIKLTISALEVLCKSSIGFSALKQIQSHATDSDVTQEQASASLEVPL